MILLRLKKQIILLFALLGFSYSLSAQDSTISVFDGLFESAPFAKPFVSEMHSTVTKIEIGYSKSYSEFNMQEESVKFNRPMVEVHWGIDAPLYAQKFGKLADNSPKWGFALSLPLSVHILEDMWDPITAAVINTDYRFGSPRLRYIRYISANKYFKNISFSWLPMFHECTHLGDEITIYRVDANLPIRRVNVSYEYSEFQLTLNDPDGTRENRHSVKIGGMYRISNRGYGWFSFRKDAEMIGDIAIENSTHRIESYVQYQFQRVKGFLAGKRAMNVFSIEARNRVRYGYPIYKMVNNEWVEKPVQERLEWCFNAYFGWKFLPKSDAKQSIGFYLHGYKGLAPYGQMRNYPSYPFFGASLTYEP